MLDETHSRLPQSPRDSNTYVLGHIHSHDVVIACLPEMGTTPAATVAQQMKLSFPDLRCALLVGIGGGIPHKDRDIRLGDVVAGVPGAKFGATVQWDSGKTVAGGDFIHRGVSSNPPPILLTAVNTLRASYNVGRPRIGDTLAYGISQLSSNVKDDFSRPAPELDVLFDPDYDFLHTEASECTKCDLAKAIKRPVRKQQIAIHFGTIASGNQVIKHGNTRDKIGKMFDAICLEMEAAGIVEDLPCLTIRGICDYSDCHKNKAWQGYAAMTAAAFTRDLLSILPSHRVNNTLVPGSLFLVSPSHRVNDMLKPENLSSDPVRVGRLNLWELNSEEGAHSWQGYWHCPRRLTSTGDSLDPETWERDKDALKRATESRLGGGSVGRFVGRLVGAISGDMEIKLAAFMHEYHSELLENLENFPDPDQHRLVFGAMLRMTKGSIDEDSATLRTLLHWLAMNGEAKLLPKLISLRFKVNAQDSDRQTPLHLAVIGNHWEAVRVLVDKCQADVHLADLNGLLPWHHALHIDWDNQAENEDREKSRISIIKCLAKVTSKKHVKGSRALKTLLQLKENPDADILF
jgi:nucleoside phosphorylase